MPQMLRSGRTLPVAVDDSLGEAAASCLADVRSVRRRLLGHRFFNADGGHHGNESRPRTPRVSPKFIAFPPLRFFVFALALQLVCGIRSYAGVVRVARSARFRA
jgi:hypothetical protein